MLADSITQHNRYCYIRTHISYCDYNRDHDSFAEGCNDWRHFCGRQGNHLTSHLPTSLFEVVINRRQEWRRVQKVRQIHTPRRKTNNVGIVRSWGRLFLYESRGRRVKWDLVLLKRKPQTIKINKTFWKFLIILIILNMFWGSFSTQPLPLTVNGKGRVAKTSSKRVQNFDFTSRQWSIYSVLNEI